MPSCARVTFVDLGGFVETRSTHYICRMLQKFRSAWGKWREKNRQNKIDSALYQAAHHGHAGYYLQQDVMTGALHLDEPDTHVPPPEQRSD